MALKEFVHMKETRRYTWVNLENGDKGAPLSVSGAAYISIQVFGDFGIGGVLGLEGSLEEDVLNYFQMHDNNGRLIWFTSAGGNMMVPTATYVRPKVAAGDETTDLTMILLTRSTR